MITSRWFYPHSLVDPDGVGWQSRWMAEVITSCSRCRLEIMSTTDDRPDVMHQVYQTHVRKLRAHGCGCYEGPDRRIVWDWETGLLHPATDVWPIALRMGSKIFCPACNEVAFIAARDVLRYEKLASEMFTDPRGEPVPYQSEIRCGGCKRQYQSICSDDGGRAVLSRPLGF